MRSLPFHFACLLAVLLGAICIFGFAPFSLWYLPILSLSAWFYLLARYNSLIQRLLLASCFGFAYFASGVGWLYISLNHYGGVPAVLAVFAVAVFAAYLALFTLLAIFLAERLVLPRPIWLVLVLPATLALGEWLRGWLFSGFPWLAVGYAQVPHTWLAGYVPVIGIYGVGYLSFLSSGVLAAVSGRAVSLRVRIMLLFVLAGMWGLGAGLSHVSWTLPVGKPVSVALLQGNIPQDQKWQEETLQATFSRYRELILSTAQNLIVLPETALPVFVHEIPDAFLQEIRQHAYHHNSDVLIGVPALTDDGRQYYNSVVSLGVSPSQAYRKIHLVPFGEFIPFKSWLQGVYRSLNIPLTDFASGDKSQAPMQVAGQRLLINICYEDVFGEELASRVDGSSILLNVTNDAWYDRSPAARQHLQIAQARALETGRYMLRSTNTGMTAIIDHRGQLLRVAPWFKTMVLTGLAQGYSGSTPYMRYGNWPVVSGCVMLLLGCVLARQRLMASMRE